MRKKLTVVLCALLSLSLFSGCSKSLPDAKELMKEVQKASEKQESVAMKMVMEMALEVGMGDSNLAMSMSMKMDGEMTMDPYAAHMKMDTTVEALGSEQTSSSEMYTIGDDDEVISYTNENDTGWSVSHDESMDMSEFLTSMQGITTEEGSEYLDDLKLEVVDTEEINGVDTYVVECVIDEEVLKKIMSEEDGDAFDDFSMIFGKDFAITYRFYIDQENKQLMRISVDLDDIFESILKIASAMGEEAENMDISLKESKFYIDFFDYNKVDEIEVPDDVIEEAERSMDDDFDFSYNEGNTATQTHEWESMEFTLEGKSFTLANITAKDLLNLGYTFDPEASDKEKLDADDIGYYTFRKGNTDITLWMSNPTSKKQNFKDCQTYGIDFYSEELDVQLPANITMNKTVSELIAAYGEANSFEEDSYYSYSSVDEDKSLTVFISDGKIYSIELNDYALMN